MAVLTNDYQIIGEKYLGNSSGNLYIRIYAKLNSQDISANTSSVTYQSRLAFTGSYIIAQGQTKVITSGTGVATTTTNWQNFEGRQDGYYYNGETVVKTITGTVQHNNSTGIASISASAEFSSSGSWGWSGTASGTADLPTIPRNSTITATSAYIEETSQLTVTRYKDEYTHSIAYSFEGLSGYILANGTTTSTETKLTATSIGFPIPYAWYSQIPTAQSGICTLTIKTYNGDTQVGNDYQTTFYARVKPYYVSHLPTATATVRDANDTTYALTGNRNILIKGYSTAEVTWTATPTPEATVRNVRINGKNAFRSPYSFTLNDTDIHIMVTDSRMMSNGNNMTYPEFTLKNYSEPTIILASIERPDPTSNYATLSFTGTWFNQNFGSQNNTLSLSWKYRETGTSNWITGGNLTNNTHYKISGNNFWSGAGSSASEITIGGNLLSYEKNWDVLLIATDKLASYQVVGTLAKGIPIINWEEDFLNVNGDIRQNGVSIFDKNNYSTSEKKIGKWIDGKPIYRKTISQTSTNEVAIYINLSDLNADTIVNVTGWVKSKWGQWWRLNNYYAYETNYWISTFYISTQLTIDMGSNFSFPEYVITLEYTKTTD